MGKRKNERVMLVACPRCRVPAGHLCVWETDDDETYRSRKPHDQRVELSDRVNPPRLVNWGLT